MKCLTGGSVLRLHGVPSHQSSISSMPTRPPRGEPWDATQSTLANPYRRREGYVVVKSSRFLGARGKYSFSNISFQRVHSLNNAKDAEKVTFTDAAMPGGGWGTATLFIFLD